ncbi:hypothetical protein C1M53_10390 [Mesorhizobium sp. Pch-S]|jgi:hypothetical protein|nr:hypothetical protein C1M53_10390 [Mesorhizobium sp. Pch-S]
MIDHLQLLLPKAGIPLAAVNVPGRSSTCKAGHSTQETKKPAGSLRRVLDFGSAQPKRRERAA